MSPHELLEALAEGSPASTAMWGAFWDGQRTDEQPRRRERAQALAAAISTKIPDVSSLAALVDSLDLRRMRPAPQGAVNIVGTGGGPSTFNISTAAALVGSTLGVRIVKSGSRAYTSRYGSIDVLELLGIPLANSYAASTAALEEFGITFVGGFVYPPELKLLLSSLAPPQRRALGHLFNRIGPFLAALDSSCQVTGVSEPSALPLLELLASRRPHRVWLCFNASGVDELLAFEENVIRASDADELRIPAGSLAPVSGSLEDLRPAARPEACVRQLTGLLVGDGPPGAVATIALNAAALLVASGLCSDWTASYAEAMRAIERGHATAQLERLRGRRARRSPSRRAVPAIFEPALHPERPGLALFLNAGDPPFATMRRLMLMLDEQGVDCVELAVPFDNTVTDGPVIRRSAARALRTGVDLGSTLAFIASLRPELSRLKIVLMADWRHTVRAVGVERFLEGGQQAGCDGVLLHGVPPRFRLGYYERARRVGMPVVATCFTSSPPAMMEEAAANARAYLYLVSHYGRGEGAAQPRREQLGPAISALRPLTSAPIAVGFGVRSAADVRVVADAGADAAILGGACVACVERAVQSGRDPVAALRRLVVSLASPAEDPPTSARG